MGSSSSKEQERQPAQRTRTTITTHPVYPVQALDAMNCGFPPRRMDSKSSDCVITPRKPLEYHTNASCRPSAPPLEVLQEADPALYPYLPSQRRVEAPVQQWASSTASAPAVTKRPTPAPSLLGPPMRQEVPAFPNSCGQTTSDQTVDGVPELCLAHPRCTRQNCRRMHVCRMFLAGICKHGGDCRFGHNVMSPHNKKVWSAAVDRMARSVGDRYKVHYSWDSKQTTMNIMCKYIKEKMGEAWFQKELQVCFKHNAGTCTAEQNCLRLHLCRRYVQDDCRFRDSACNRGHSLRTAHNKHVLTVHRALFRTDGEILSLLNTNDRSRDAKTQSGGVNADRKGAKTGKGDRRPGGKDAKTDSGDTALRAVSQLELECAVCYELFQRATTLGCGHTFCEGCVEALARKGLTRCPTCQGPIVSKTRSYALDAVVRCHKEAKREDTKEK